MQDSSNFQIFEGFLIMLAIEEAPTVTNILAGCRYLTSNPRK
jgi:hypothetical protein